MTSIIKNHMDKEGHEMESTTLNLGSFPLTSLNRSHYRAMRIPIAHCKVE